MKQLFAILLCLIWCTGMRGHLLDKSRKASYQDDEDFKYMTFSPKTMH